MALSFHGLRAETPRELAELVCKRESGISARALAKAIVEDLGLDGVDANIDDDYELGTRDIHRCLSRFSYEAATNFYAAYMQDGLPRPTSLPGEETERGEQFIGPWRLSGTVYGKGGFGAVLGARTSDDVPIAVKRVETDKEARHEHAMLRELDHPAIPKCHGVQGNCIALDPIVGTNLRTCLMREGPLGEAEIWDIAEQIADALAHVHSRRITHGDIKHANVMRETDENVFSASNGPLKYRLIDFGEGKAAKQTQSVEDSPADSAYASDVAMFGTLLTTLCGLLTWSFDTPEEPPTVSSQLQKTIDACASEPEDRPTSARLCEMIRELRRG